MAVRQYVGARYVPVFADPVQWSDTRTYEPLTMVQNAGETYMSRQHVPAGIQLPSVSTGEESNDYWVHMSNWNAQVEGYREEVLRYAEQVLGFDGRIEANSDAISDFNQELGQYEDTTNGRLDVIEADAWVTNNRIAANAVTTEKIANNTITNAKLANNVVLIGDSWGEGWTPDGNVTSWITRVKAHLESMGKTVFSRAQGGIGIIANGGWIPVINSLVGDMSVAERESVGTVLIAGGWNDNGSTSSSAYETPIANLCEAITTFFPNARFIYDWIGNGLYTNSVSRVGSARMYSAFMACSIANNNNDKMQLVYGVETLVSEMYFASDGYHPNELGSKWVAKHIIGTLEGENVIVPQYGYDITLTREDSVHDGSIEINSAYTNSHSFNETTKFARGAIEFTDSVSRTFNRGPIFSFVGAGDGCNKIKKPYTFEIDFILRLDNPADGGPMYRNGHGILHMYPNVTTGLSIGLYAGLLNYSGTSYLSANVSQIQFNTQAK